MVPNFKVMAKAFALFKALLLFVLKLLPSFNINSDISLKGSASGSVKCNINVDVNADAQARLEVVGNVNSDVKVNGGSLKFLINVNSDATLKDCDLEVTTCVNSDIFGQRNKGTFRNFINSDFTGNDNELDVADCANCFFQSNKMTIFAADSKDLRVQDSSNSKVKMLRVDSVQVSGKDFTLEGTDIQDHAFIGKGCSSGEKITHYLTFLPERPSHPDHASYYWDIEKNVYIHGGMFINGVQVFSPNQRVNNKEAWPRSLHFCNAAKVIGTTYEIGGLPRLTIKIEGEKERAVIKVIDGNPECKIVSEDRKMKVSISTSSEQLIIEAKDIRRVEGGKCEFILSLKKDSDKGGSRRFGL